MPVNKALRVRKVKAQTRTRDQRLRAAGRARAEEISLARALGPAFYRQPLGVAHIRTSDDPSCERES